MSDNWERHHIWIDPIGNQYRDMQPVSANWVRYVPHSEAAAELARLRAEVERLTAALAVERRHADALAEALDSAKQHIGFNVAMLNALESHRARRQG